MSLSVGIGISDNVAAASGTGIAVITAATMGDAIVANAVAATLGGMAAVTAAAAAAPAAVIVSSADTVGAVGGVGACVGDNVATCDNVARPLIVVPVGPGSLCHSAVPSAVLNANTLPASSPTKTAVLSSFNTKESVTTFETCGVSVSEVKRIIELAPSSLMVNLSPSTYVNSTGT